MKFICIVIALITAITVIGCESENPICSPSYCVTGEIFARSELETDQEFSDMPGHINEDSILDFWTLEVNANFEPVTVTGELDWDFSDESWQYREGGTTYLKKVILEFPDNGKFGDNRIILVHLNKDTVRRDRDGTYVEFLGDGSIHLTEHIGIATYRGNIVDAPVKE